MSLVNCTFADNILSSNDEGAAVIEAEYGLSQVRLDGCSFSNNSLSTLPTLLADNRGSDGAQGAVFYSNSSPPFVCTYAAGGDISTPPPCDTSDPLPLADAGSGFLSEASAWFVQLQQVCL